MKLFSKKNRGEYGYIHNKKRNSLFGTLLMTLCGVIIFVAGFVLNDMSNKNIFTVLAMLFVLPGAKFLVAFIVVFPHRSAPRELYEKVKDVLPEQMTLFSDMVITSSEKIMQLDFVTVGNGQVLGLVSGEKQDLPYIRGYLTKGVRNWGSDYKIKIFDSEKKFLTELSNVKPEETDREEEEKVRSYLLSLII